MGNLSTSTKNKIGGGLILIVAPVIIGFITELFIFRGKDGYIMDAFAILFAFNMPILLIGLFTLVVGIIRGVKDKKYGANLAYLYKKSKTDIVGFEEYGIHENGLVKAFSISPYLLKGSQKKDLDIKVYEGYIEVCGDTYYPKDYVKIKTPIFESSDKKSKYISLNMKFSNKQYSYKISKEYTEYPELVDVLYVWCKVNGLLMDLL